MMHTRLPKKTEQTNAQLAAELRKQWPPAYRIPRPSTAPKHLDQHAQYKQTGDRA